MTQRQSIAILGVTGSVGACAVDVVSSAPEGFAIRAVSANRNVDKLVDCAVQLNADKAVIGDEALYEDLKQALAGTGIEAMAGEAALCEVAAEQGLDVVLNAIVGMAGLKPLMAALEAGISVAVANKEPLVSAGPLVMATARKSGARLLPVDSEHNAIFQVFEEANRDAIERIILTASGGPFREWPLDKIRTARKEEALQHPTWDMGAKITIDSATMMNKALEVIEAHYLFAMPAERIGVLIHPQSVVHSMVEYTDGSVLAQMGASDMRTPVTHALAWPERMATPGQKLDLTQMSELRFERPDEARFPALPLAYHCLEKGAQSCISMNAANEVCVAAFLEDRIAFGDIVNLVEKSVDIVNNEPITSLDQVIELDHYVRTKTLERIAG